MSGVSVRFMFMVVSFQTDIGDRGQVGEDPLGQRRKPVEGEVEDRQPRQPREVARLERADPLFGCAEAVDPDDVIAARCVAVTSAQSLTPAISARITSWIFSVRSQMPVVWACAGRANAPESASSAAAASRPGGLDEPAPSGGEARETRRPGGPIRGYGIGIRRGTAAPAGRQSVRRRWRAALLPRPRRSHGLGARRSALLVIRSLPLNNHPKVKLIAMLLRNRVPSRQRRPWQRRRSKTSHP